MVALPVGRAWAPARVTVPVLSLALVALGLLFGAEVVAAVRVWLASTAYNHCFLVIPIAAFLAYDRRDRLAGVPVRSWPWAALLVLPLAAAWLVAERVGVMEGRQLIAMTVVQVLFLGVLGPRLYRVLAAPLLYLFFLVPFGGFLTPALQSFTSHFVTHGLDLFGIPNYTDGNTIEIPQGTFYVAEACAGLRFLIAAIAFGVLYALVIYRSPGRRITFVAVSLVVPVIANGLRALGIVTLGNLIGSARAAATDHVLYGWLFFSIVLLLLILLGLPFRQDAPVRRVPVAATSAPRVAAAGVAAAVVVLVAAIGPAAASVLDRSAGAAPAVRLALGGACREAAPGRDAPGLLVRTIACGGHRLTVRVQAFPARTDPGQIVSAENRVSAPLGAEDTVTHGLAVAGAAPGTWRIVLSQMPDRTVAVALWVGGRPSGTGLAMRLGQARASLLGGSAAASVLATVEPAATDAATAMQALRAFFEAEPDVTSALSRAAQ